MTYYVYMMASGVNGTLYVGVTSDLVARMHQHREHVLPGFTDKYAVTRLVWFDLHDDINEAILAEKRMKRWRREWKLRAIRERNPTWRDLWHDLAS